MAAKNDPPFKRGKTKWEGNIPLLPSGSADTESNADLEGKEFDFEDIDWGATAETKPTRTGRYVRVRCVRNESGGAILPKQLCKMKTDGTAYEYAGRVLSNSPTLGDLCYPADEFLPSGGVANHDLFFVVVEGPAMCKTDTAGDTNISTGSWVIPGATTAGRVIDQDVTVAAGAATFNQIQGAVGRAILGVNGTSLDILVDVVKKG